MASIPLHPWFQGCLELVDLRKHDRALLVIPASEAEVRAVTDLTGRNGAVLCLEPLRQRAERWAAIDLPTLEVVHRMPDGSERFGTFDVLVACPLTSPPWGPATWAGLTINNLRPGGRFVVDLPAPQMSEDLTAAWFEAGGTEDGMEPMRGPDEEELAAALRKVGLRRVQAVLATELLSLETPHDLADLFTPALAAEEGLRAELGLALARRLRTTGAVQILLRRTRVHGIR